VFSFHALSMMSAAPSPSRRPWATSASASPSIARQ